MSRVGAGREREAPRLRATDVLLVLHGPHDQVVDIDHARRIFEAARHPKSFVSLADADHLLSRKEDAVYVATVLAAWATRYVGTQEPSAERRMPTELGTVVVAEAGTGKYAQRIEAGGHTLRADEPAAYGGDDARLSTRRGKCAALPASLFTPTVVIGRAAPSFPPRSRRSHPVIVPSTPVIVPIDSGPWPCRAAYRRGADRHPY